MALKHTVLDKLIPAIVVADAWMNKQIQSNKSISVELAWLVRETQTNYASSGFGHDELFIFLKACWKFLGDASVFLSLLSLEHTAKSGSLRMSVKHQFPVFSNVVLCHLFRNATYCMKVSMSMTVEESDEGKCFSSKIRHLEKAEITHSKMITCPDIDDYLAPYKQPQMSWYKVQLTLRKVRVTRILCVLDLD